MREAGSAFAQAEGNVARLGCRFPPRVRVGRGSRYRRLRRRSEAGIRGGVGGTGTAAPVTDGRRQDGGVSGPGSGRRGRDRVARGGSPMGADWATTDLFVSSVGWVGGW